jgi:hypothetical protein
MGHSAIVEAQNYSSGLYGMSDAASGGCRRCDGVMLDWSCDKKRKFVHLLLLS